MPFPKRVVQCPVCHEPRGDGSTCLCEGIACRRCGAGRIPRPITDQFDPRDGAYWHTPHFGYLAPCPSCSALAASVDGPAGTGFAPLDPESEVAEVLSQLRDAASALSNPAGAPDAPDAGLIAVYIDEAGREELGLAGPDKPVAVTTFDGDPAIPGFVAVQVGTHLRLVREELWTWLDEHATVTAWACAPSMRRRQLCLELGARWRPAFGCP